MTTDPLPDVFATLSFAGDNLDPNEIRWILPVPPRRAHRKGERYYSGPRAGYLNGVTGIWILETDAFTDSRELADHVSVLRQVLYPAPDDNRRVMQLRDVLAKTGAGASISVFWHGHAGEAPPAIPAELALLAQVLGATIEVDYDTEDAAAVA